MWALRAATHPRCPVGTPTDPVATATVGARWRTPESAAMGAPTPTSWWHDAGQSIPCTASVARLPRPFDPRSNPLRI